MSSQIYQNNKNEIYTYPTTLHLSFINPNYPKSKKLIHFSILPHPLYNDEDTLKFVVQHNKRKLCWPTKKIAQKCRFEGKNLHLTCSSPILQASSMALLLRPTEMSSLTAARAIPRIRIRKGIRISVCSVKDVEILRIRDDDFDEVRRLYGTAPFKGNDEEVKKRDCNVNRGYAIRTLREEFPQLFYKELNFDIYRDDIVFRDPINAFAGIDNYKSIFWGLRFHGRMFFSALWVEIVSVRQPVENRIMVRWIVHGTPRVPWESRSRFDGASEYKLDKDGKIYEHNIHNIALNGHPFTYCGALDSLQFSSSSTRGIAPLSFESSQD